MNSPKLHVVFAGPGGSGKSTLLSALKEKHPELGLQDQINDTTRMRRDNEEVTSDYNHICEQEYIELQRAGMYISTRQATGKNKLGEIENQWYGLQEPEHDKTAFIVDGPGINYRQFSLKVSNVYKKLCKIIHVQCIYGYMLRFIGNQV